jgi:threonine dehydrogenase-like Zn-dependent dehydrogenase
MEPGAGNGLAADAPPAAAADDAAVIVVGYGPVGQLLALACADAAEELLGELAARLCLT